MSGDQGTSRSRPKLATDGAMCYTVLSIAIKRKHGHFCIAADPGRLGQAVLDSVAGRGAPVRDPQLAKDFSEMGVHGATAEK